MIICAMFPGIPTNEVTASVEVSFAYSLSDFSGPVPYNWANICADEKRNEIYVVDLRERDVRIFNEKGMEVYRFGDGGSLGNVVAVAVENSGNILALSKGSVKYSIRRYDFRGEPLEDLELANLPSQFSGFSPDCMLFKNEHLYLADTVSMKIIVTDGNGMFQNGYDLYTILEIQEKKKIGTEIGGFNIDGDGNMLFTVPVLFSAYTLSLDGKVQGFGTPGSAPGRFGVVGGIASDKEGNIYVADRLRSVVLVFDKQFKFQKEFGYRGEMPDNLISPTNLVLDVEDKLYVSQFKSRGVSVFQITYAESDRMEQFKIEGG